MEDTNVQSGTVSTGIVATLINIFTSPREAFDALAVRPTVLLPILALVILNVALVLWYYGEVDFVWLLQTTLEASGQEIPPGLADGQPPGMTGTILSVAAVVSTVLRILIVLLVIAAYLSLVSMFKNDGVTFKSWLSLAAWSSMPTLLGVLSGLVNLAVNDAANMPPMRLNLLSFGSLLGADAVGGGIARGLLLGMDLTVLWALALMIYGHAMWTRRPPAVSFAIIGGPVLVLGGLLWLLA